MCLYQGVDKRDLLRYEVLPSMAANRTVHRLVNEILDRLADMEEEQVRKVDDLTILPSDMRKDNTQGAGRPKTMSCAAVDYKFSCLDR